MDLRATSRASARCSGWRISECSRAALQYRYGSSKSPSLILARRMRRTASSTTDSASLPLLTRTSTCSPYTLLSMSMSVPAVIARRAASDAGGCEPVRTKLSDRSPIAHHEAVESPLFSEDVRQELPVPTAWDSGDLVERTHDCGCSSLHRRLERREIDVPKRTFRNVHGIVVPPPSAPPYAAKCLGQARIVFGFERSSPWKPLTCAAAMAAPRYGSSPEPSAMRPQRGSRAISTIGANVQ